MVDSQLSAIADNISDFENVVVAYEPVWAIGTGKVGQQPDRCIAPPFLGLNSRTARARSKRGVKRRPISRCLQVASPDQAQEVHQHIQGMVPGADRGEGCPESSPHIWCGPVEQSHLLACLTSVWLHRRVSGRCHGFSGMWAFMQGRGPVVCSIRTIVLYPVMLTAGLAAVLQVAP